MANKARNTSGKFAPKSDTPRKIRSVNLTDEAWQWLADVAEEAGMSRNDYLEALAQDYPFMEMGSSETLPLMEMVEAEIKTESANTAQQPDSETYPLMETASSEIEALNQELKAVRTEHQWLQNSIGNSETERGKLAQGKKDLEAATTDIRRQGRSVEFEKVRWQRELSNARAELADAKAIILKQGGKIRELERGYNFKPNPVESALRLEISNLQAELAELKQKSVAAWDLPEAADLLNQLKAKRKKSVVTLADVEFLLELLEG